MENANYNPTSPEDLDIDKTEEPIPGESSDPEADSIKREPDDKELVPEDDDFEKEYGDIEGGQENTTSPKPDEPEEYLE